MKSITELLNMESNGETLTEEEQSYLNNYKAKKQYRHSPSFVYHSRKLPREDDERAN